MIETDIYLYMQWRNCFSHFLSMVSPTWWMIIWIAKDGLVNWSKWEHQESGPSIVQFLKQKTRQQVEDQTQYLRWWEMGLDKWDPQTTIESLNMESCEVAETIAKNNNAIKMVSSIVASCVWATGNQDEDWRKFSWFHPSLAPFDFRYPAKISPGPHQHCWPSHFKTKKCTVRIKSMSA